MCRVGNHYQNARANVALISAAAKKNRSMHVHTYASTIYLSTYIVVVLMVVEFYQVSYEIQYIQNTYFHQLCSYMSNNWPLSFTYESCYQITEGNWELIDLVFISSNLVFLHQFCLPSWKFLQFYLKFSQPTVSSLILLFFAISIPWVT